MTNPRLWMLLCLAVSWTPFMVSLKAISTTVVISEFRTRGPNGGNDEFIELHNLSTSPVNIGGWKINGSNSGGTVGTRVTITAGVVLNPGCFYLATNSAAGGYSGAVPGNQTFGTGVTDDGGIALLGADNLIVDQVGMSAGSAYKEGTPLTSLTTNTNRSYERKPGGNAGFTDTDNNSVDFQELTPSNPQSSNSPCLVTGALSIAGSVTPNPVIQFESVRITGAVTKALSPTSTGIAATANLSAIGGLASQPLVDDGTSGDVTANDNIYSFELPVSVAPGSYGVSLQVTDAQSRLDTDTFNLVVQPPPTIYLPHDIQGSGLVSPLVGTSVIVEGVVTGRRSNGVFIQTAVGKEDADALTSEGVFVFTGAAPPAGAAVGTLVRATGTVTEFNGDGNGYTQTELGSAISFTFHGASPLPVATTLTPAQASPAGSVNQLEPLENMLVFIPSLTSVSGTDGFFASGTGGEASGIATSDGVFFAVLTGTPRPVREPGLELPLAATFANQCASGAPCNIPVFDSNPERLRVDSDAIGGPIRDVTAGVTITNLTGIIDSGFLTWGLLPVPSSPGTVGPNALPIAAAAAGATQFTVASFNMQRFFDTINDPLVPSDVALTPTNYANRLAKASLAIRTALHMPDVLAVQEVENLATLQAIADRVNADAGLSGEYSAYLQEGNDIGGIDVGFLVRSRVHVSSVVQFGKDATYIDPNTGQPALLNDRPPLVLRGIVDGPPNRLDASIIVVVNHLRSLNGVDTDARVRAKRQKQAELLADLLDALQDEGAVISVGDYNAFEFSDGLVDVLGTVLGDPTAPNEVVVASPDLTEPDFFVATAGDYSYVFDGSAQTLDHVLLSTKAQELFAGLQHARINADFPEVFRNDPARVERLSDHDPAVAYFEFPLDTVPPTVVVTPSLSSLGSPNHKLVPIALSITATDNLGVDQCKIAGVTSNEPINGVGDGNTNPDWIIDGPSSLQLRSERSGTGSDRIYTLTVDCVDVAGNVGSATTEVTVAHSNSKTQ